MRLFNIALGVLLALLFPGALGAPEPWLYTTDGYSPTHLKATVCRHAYYSDCIIVGGYPNTCCKCGCGLVNHIGTLCRLIMGGQTISLAPGWIKSARSGFPIGPEAANSTSMQHPDSL